MSAGARTNPKLREHLPRLSGKRLICHCLPSQECHADSIIVEYKLLFPDAYDREDTKGAVPSSAALRRLSELREELESDGGPPQTRMSPRKVRGGLDVEAHCWLVQVIPCVRFATDSRSRRLDAGRWRTEGTQRIQFGARCLDTLRTTRLEKRPSPCWTGPALVLLACRWGHVALVVN